MSMWMCVLIYHDVVIERSAGQGGQSSMGSRTDTLVSMSAIEVTKDKVIDLATSRSNLRVEEDAIAGFSVKVGIARLSTSI